MGKIEEMLEKIKKDLRPKQLKIKEVDNLILKINSLIKKNKIKATAHAGGSYAKGTFLKESHDVDIFVAFDLSYKDEEISSILGKVLKPLRPTRVHGSRDYYQLKKTYNIEIVPVFAIQKESDAKNVTDFSLKHVTWVKKEGKNYKDDIRLAKQFCKAAEIYGAESYIAGFSGHVLDILVIYHKGFVNVLKKSKLWKPKTVIDYYKVHKGRALFNLNTSKTQSGLVVIDPIQPQRNAAAALSLENMEKFQKQAKAFLKKPSELFFEEKETDLISLKKKGALIIQCATQKGKRDVSGAKALKVFEYLKKKIDEDFGIKTAGWSWKNEFVMWFIPKHTQLSDFKEHMGPPLEKKNFVTIFKKKYKKTSIRKGKLIAQIKRKHTQCIPFLKQLIKQSYVSQRVNNAKLLNTK